MAANDPKLDAAWLAQFSPVDESTLSDTQRHFVTQLRAQFPGGKVGRRASDGRLDFYVIAPTGPFHGPIPAA